MEKEININDLTTEQFQMRRAFDNLAMAVSSLGGPKSKRLMNVDQVLHEKANGNWSLPYFEGVVKKKVKAYMFGGRELYFETDLDKFIADHAIDIFDGARCDFLGKERDMYPNNPKPRKIK